MLVLHGTSFAAISVRAAIGMVVAFAIVLVSYRLKLLTKSGAIAALLIGTLAFSFGGVPVAVAILFFFGSGNILSRVRNASSDEARSRASKGAERDAWQVIGNGGVAVGCAMIAAIGASYAWSDAARFLVSSVCAISAASGDTWSTEIGSLWGGRPRLASTFQPVPSGESGGITLLGILAAPAGGAFVALAGLFQPVISPLRWLVAGAVGGLAGSLLDSVAGAALQARWRCPNCSRQLETRTHEPCRRQGTLVAGLPWLDNDAVNLIATLTGAIVGYALGPA